MKTLKNNNYFEYFQKQVDLRIKITFLKNDAKYPLTI